ncbi:hypothetical protein ACTFIU_006865 [Dictyostelium citrinum]
MDSSTANSSGTAIGKAEWKPDQSSLECNDCQLPFTLIRRRHHCRKCGSIFCDSCSSFYSILPIEYGYTGQQRLCRSCNNSFEQKKQYFETDALVAQFQLRSTAQFEYSKPLQDIGHTKHGLRKSYCMAKNSMGSGEECVVSIITPTASTCPWSMSNEKKKRKFEKTLLSLKHPYILTPLKVEVSGANDKILVIRTFLKHGSLRDQIYKSKPLSPYETKYVYKQSKSSSQSQSVLPIKSIQKYCKQILESLLYLKSKGIQFSHLHLSNVLINQSNDTCQLVDIENCLLGMKPLFNDYIYGNGLSSSSSSSSSPQSFKDNLEVICFGHCLFEMIIGIPLGDHSNINSFIPLFPDKVFLLLQQIFSDKTPSLEELVKNPWFEVTTTMEQQSLQNGKLKKSQLSFIKDTSNKFESPKASLSGSFSSSNISKLSSSSSSSSNNNNNTLNNTSNIDDKRKSMKLPSSNSLLNNSFNLSNNNNPSSPTSSTISPNSSLISSPPKTPLLQTFTPPTPPPKSAPPPPPPPSSKLPPSSSGRNSLLESIRNADNIKKLKKTTPNTKPKSSIGPHSLKPSSTKKK